MALENSAKNYLRITNIHESESSNVSISFNIYSTKQIRNNWDTIDQRFHNVLYQTEIFTSTDFNDILYTNASVLAENNKTKRHTAAAYIILKTREPYNIMTDN